VIDGKLQLNMTQARVRNITNVTTCRGSETAKIWETVFTPPPTYILSLYMYYVRRYVGWGCMLNCLMLSSLLCFPAFLQFQYPYILYELFPLVKSFYTDEMGQRAIIGRLVGDVSPPGIPVPPEYLPETIAEAEEVLLVSGFTSYFFYVGSSQFVYSILHNYYIEIMKQAATYMFISTG